MKRNYLIFIASLVLFGSNGIVAERISLESHQVVMLRTFIGTAFLAAPLIARRRTPAVLRDRRSLALLTASGLSMGASWLFLYEAYRTVGVGISSLAYYCAPVIVMALSPWLFGERLAPAKIAGFCTVLAGALLINLQADGGAESAWGLFCGWMSALAHAAMVVFSKKADQVDGVESSAVQLAASFLLAAAFTACQDDCAFRVAADEWPWALMLGVVNTGLGCYGYFSSLGGLPAQTVAVLGYLEPLSAVVLAALLVHETMGPAQMLGAVLSVGGALASELTARRRRPRPG